MVFADFVRSVISLIKVPDVAVELSKPLRLAPELPPEVISTILEHGYFDEDHKVDTRFLVNCSLVCRAWSEPARNMLFRDVRLQTMTDYESFCSAVDNDSHRVRSLADVVVRLRLVIDLKHSDALSHGAFGRAIRLCPNLYELDLAVYGGGYEGSMEHTLDAGAATDTLRVSVPAPSFSATMLNTLRLGPRIQSLKFTNLTDNGNLTLQLLDVWPSLIALELKGILPLLPVVPEDASNPFQCACKLTNVRLGLNTQPKVAFIDWLLGNSGDTIRSLELSQETSIEVLSSVLRTYGHQLYSLALPSCTPREYVAAVISHCTSLRELSLGSASPALSPLLFKQLTCSLEHVAFALSRDTPLYPVLRFISDRKKNAHLNVVTVLLWGGAEVHPQLPSLKMACAMQGVELRIITNPWAFRTLIRGDSIPSSTFPHSKSVANLYHMLAISRAGSSVVERNTACGTVGSEAPVFEERHLPECTPGEDDDDPGLRDLGVVLDAAVPENDEDVDDKAAVREDELSANWKVTASV